MHFSPLIVSVVSVGRSPDRRNRVGSRGSEPCVVSTPAERSLDQVVETFLSDCRARNLSPRTLEHYDWAIRSFRSSLGTDPGAHVLADLEPDAVRTWIAVLSRTRKPVSVRSAVRGLKVLGRS